MGLCVSIAISILQQTPASYPVRCPPDDRYVSDEYVYSAQCPTWRTKRISRPASIKGCGWKCHQKPPKWVDKRMQTPAGSVYIFLMFQIRFPLRRNEMSRLQAYYWCVCLSLSPCWAGKSLVISPLLAATNQLSDCHKSTILSNHVNY